MMECVPVFLFCSYIGYSCIAGVYCNGVYYDDPYYDDIYYDGAYYDGVYCDAMPDINISWHLPCYGIYYAMAFAIWRQNRYH